MIHVVAMVTTKPGERDRVLEAFREILPTVRAEDGCIEYGTAIDAPGAIANRAELGPDVLVVIEKWSSVETLQTHRAAPHMAAFGAKTRGSVISSAVHVLDGQG